MFLLYVRLAFGHVSMSRDPNSYRSRRQCDLRQALVVWSLVSLCRYSIPLVVRSPLRPKARRSPGQGGLVVACSRESSACINSRALVLRQRLGRWVRRPLLDPPVSTSTDYLEDAKAVGRLPVQHHRAVTVITLHAPLLPPLFSSSLPCSSGSTRARQESRCM